MSNTVQVTRNITGKQMFTDNTIIANKTEVRKTHMDELRDKTQKIVTDIDNHIGNYGDHHKNVDSTNAGFMTPEQKKLLEDHTHDMTGIDGLAHGLVSPSRNGFMSVGDYNALHRHIGFGGTDQHPLATDDVAGFLGPQEKKWLETMMPQDWATKRYVDEHFEYFTRSYSQSFDVGSDFSYPWTLYGDSDGYSYVISDTCPAYKAYFDLRPLKNDVGVPIKLINMSISASGAGYNDYFRGSMGLATIISDFTLPPQPYLSDADAPDSIAVTGVFTTTQILGHPYHMSGSVDISMTVTAVRKEDYVLR